VGEDIAEDIGGERRVLGQHLNVISGLFPRGIGIDLAAHGLDLLGDGGGAAAGGALEGHVFEEMRDPVLGPRFVAGAGADIGTDGDTLHPVHLFGDDGKAGGQAGDADRGWICHPSNIGRDPRSAKMHL
jgi:hypothetical protein